jgi:hypothetical protein
MYKKMNAKQMAQTILSWFGTSEFGYANAVGFAKLQAIWQPKFYGEVIGIIRAKGVNRQNRRRGKTA